MAITQLARDDWSTYFDDLSKRFADDDRPEYAEIRVLSMEDGAQPETSWLPLNGLTYDRKGDLLEVFVEGMDHLVYHPQEIYVDEDAGELSSLEIVRTDGTKEIIEIR